MKLDPALNVACPTCRVKAGEPCRSRHAIRLHQARRQALADLGAQADRILVGGGLTEEEIEAGRSPQGGWTAAQLAAWGVPWPPPKGWRKRLVAGDDEGKSARPVPVFAGRTGAALPETAEYWPPWEDPPVAGCLAESGIPVTGLVWCPIHEDYEELRDGVPAVRLEARK